MLPNNGCPTIFVLVCKVGIDRPDNLGTGTVVFCVLSGWYSSTRQCDSSTVARDSYHVTIERATVAVVLYHFSRTILLVPRILVVWSEEPDRLEPKLPASKGSNNNIKKEPEGGL